ncbi:NCS2 family permease [Hazenella sp. IB182357]|uniref:NCS2 family permease n=1 Tax=Polycladospora coralii TaxID=2771432 RepID=A0A926RX83_9BACL|nr:NCS2 family permease [Polycladospora coralii]MBS7531539.1 NCS2 family permease [Polycladospora coralii]
MAQYFGFQKQNTNFKTEFLAGMTTFFTMAYILLVAPSILGKTGMDMGAVFVATALAAAIGTFLMGVIANYPIALAPGMGLIAYFAFSVVLGMGISWEKALGAVFISGVLFFVLTVTKVRELIINSIPPGMKYAVSAGIGLFIAFIGLKNAQIIVASEATFVTLNAGLTSSPDIMLTLIGLIVTAILMVRKIKGAIFIGMLFTALAGIFTGIIPIPTSFVAMPPSITPTFMQLDIIGALELGFITIIFAFLFVDLFDNAGTLVGVTSQAGLLKDNKLERGGRALLTDSFATIGGSILGTSTVTSYIESSAGVASGGKTGMTSVTTALFFMAALFFYPLVEVFAGIAAITSPALIVVGVLMASNLPKIEWNALSEAIPAFLTIIMMPLTFSIANGIAIGFVFYPLCKVFAGEGKNVHPIVYVLGVIFVLRFIFLGSI